MTDDTPTTEPTTGERGRADWLSMIPSGWSRDALVAGLSLLMVEAMPAGYGRGVVGVALFGFGGVGDFFWHSAFGFEEGVEALVSPSHIALAVGAALFLGSPSRAALSRPEEFEGRRFLPVLVSTSLVLTVVVLFGLLVNPLAQLSYIVDDPVFRTYALGWNALVFFPLLFVATGLVLARRFDVPPGALTLTFIAVSLDHDGAIDGRWADVGVVLGVLGAVLSIILLV